MAEFPYGLSGCLGEARNFGSFGISCQFRGSEDFGSRNVAGRHSDGQPTWGAVVGLQPLADPLSKGRFPEKKKWDIRPQFNLSP